MRKSTIIFSNLLLVGCVSWDSNKFQPTSDEIKAAAKIQTKQRADKVDLDKCIKLGELKTNSLEKGQNVTVVAIRKYKDATLIRHIESRMDGGLNGESRFNFFEVYRCY